MNKTRTTALALSSLLIIAVVTLLSQPGQAQTGTDKGYVEQPRVYHFSHNVTHRLKTGETVEATLDAAAGCKATFDLGQAVVGIPMTEVSPGHYVGKYALEPRIYNHETVWVTAHIKGPRGESTHVAAVPIDLAP